MLTCNKAKRKILQPTINRYSFMIRSSEILHYNRKDDLRVKELFDDMEKMRQQFESIARPMLEIETPSPKSSVSSPKSPKPSSSMDAPTESTLTQKPELSNPPEAPKTTAGSSQEFNPEAELAELESEFGKVARDYSADEVDGWEFDELEKELQ